MENEILRIVADILERSPEELHLDQTFEELEIDSILLSDGGSVRNDSYPYNLRTKCC